MTVCDREGDFWKLLARAKETGAALLVRASKSNKRRAELPSGERTRLWEHMREAKSLGARTVEAPERGGPFRRKARTARLTVRCEAVDLVPPVEVGGATMRMVAVSAREERPAKAVEAKKEALHWLLPATEGEPGAGTAATALRWYELRWRIKHYFDALKNYAHSRYLKEYRSHFLMEFACGSALGAVPGSGSGWIPPFFLRGNRHLERRLGPWRGRACGVPRLEAPAASGHPEALAGTENPLARRQCGANPKKMEKENKYE